MQAHGIYCNYLQLQQIVVINFFFKRSGTLKKIDKKEKNDECEDNSDNDASNDVGRMVFVVGYTSEGDVQSQSEITKLKNLSSVVEV